MEKWEQQLKSNVNPQIPQELNDHIRNTLEHTSSIQLIKKKRKNRFMGLAAAIFILIVPFGVSYFSPSFAATMQSVPVIGSVFELVGNMGERKGSEEGLTTVLGQQLEVNGQTITFTESLYDGTQIYIGYIVEDQELHFNDAFLHDMYLTINGNRIHYGMGAGGKVLDNGDYAGILSIKTDVDLPDQFMLGLHSEKNKWEIELLVEKQGDHESFLINETKESDDLIIHYDRISFYPTSTEITFRQIMSKSTFESEKYTWLVYQVFDDEGRQLQQTSGGGGGGEDGNGNIIETQQHYFDPLTDIPQSVTIKPYLLQADQKHPEYSRGKWEGEQLTLSQGDIGHVKILNVEQNENDVTVTLEPEGDDPILQTQVWFQDKDGNEYYSTDFPKRVEGTVKQYNLTFSSLPTDIQDLTLVTPKLSSLIYLEDLEITVELEELQTGE